jgi:hypothetical protein
MGQSSREVARRLNKRLNESQQIKIHQQEKKKARGGLTRSQFKKSMQGKKKQ